MVLLIILTHLRQLGYEIPEDLIRQYDKTVGAYLLVEYPLKVSHVTLMSDHVTIMRDHVTILSVHVTILSVHVTILRGHVTILRGHVTILSVPIIVCL